ncbi:MAG: HAMP domain-containing sensor histidine kinase [Nitriliruptor sp.]
MGAAPDGMITEQELERRLALIAHELVSPLVVAQGYSSVLADQLDGVDGEAAEYAGRVSENIDLALLLLQRLRDTTASADDLRLQRSPFELGAVVARTIADLSHTIADQHPVTVRTPDKEVKVDADQTRVRQVLFNLMVNASKYSPDGEPIEVTLTADDGWASIEVRNHGFGVAPEDAERLFQKGARGESRGHEGLGVGLYISRAIAEAHGGGLHVEPAEVRGSRFILRLPTC